MRAATNIWYQQSTARVISGDRRDLGKDDLDVRRSQMRLGGSIGLVRNLDVGSSCQCLAAGATDDAALLPLHLKFSGTGSRVGPTATSAVDYGTLYRRL